MRLRHLDTISAQSLVDALDGVAYLTDSAGIILAIGERNWIRFAREGGLNLTCKQLIGTSIFDYIKGSDVRQLYSDMLDSIAHGGEDAILPFRCDSPSARRDMTMSISPITENGAVIALVFQSQTQAENYRPPMNIFSYRPSAERRKIVKMCSFCHAIEKRVSDEPVAQWISVEAYYQTGGHSDVEVSHGICPDCFENLKRQ